MTRINVIPPSELTRQHLLAERREAPRVFGLVRRAIARGERPDDPRNLLAYTLGTGHVRFFYSRLGWLITRCEALTQECLARGYNLTETSVAGLTTGIPEQWLGDWTPTEHAFVINKARIADRLRK